jgi:hypothetical protein
MPYSLDRRRRRNVFLGTNTLFMDVITESHNMRWQCLKASSKEEQVWVTRCAKENEIN